MGMLSVSVALHIMTPSWVRVCASVMVTSEVDTGVTWPCPRYVPTKPGAQHRKEPWARLAVPRELRRARGRASPVLPSL